MANFCTECGSPLTDGQAFCSNCGAKTGAAPIYPAAPDFEDEAAYAEPEDFDDSAPAKQPLSGFTPYGDPSYSIPDPEFSEPQEDNSTPQGGNSEQNFIYSAPQNDYSDPKSEYSAPQGGYSVPGGGYSVPGGGSNPSYSAETYGDSIPPKNKRAIGIVIGVAAVLVILAIVAVVAVFRLAVNGASAVTSGPEMALVAGEWDGVYAMIDGETVDIGASPIGLILLEDGSGILLGSDGSAVDLRYSFDRIDSDGDYDFDVETADESCWFYYEEDDDDIVFVITDKDVILFVR